MNEKFSTNEGQRTVPELIDLLTFNNYKANRVRAPEVTVERWKAIYGIAQTEAMEAKYQAELAARRIVVTA